MSFEELLKSLGYTDEQIKSITEGMKTNKIHLSKEENADIRLPKLQQDLDAKGVELDEANKLIKTLQDSAKGNDDLQTKITEYETKIAQLQEENKQEKIKNQLALELKDAGVTDESYIAFKIEQKLKEDNKSLELTDDGKIKGIKELIDAEKKTSPNFFKSETKKEVDVKDLGKQKEQLDEEPKDLKSALIQAYNEKTNSDI